jgi:hypothetical protein
MLNVITFSAIGGLEAALGPAGDLLPLQADATIAAIPAEAHT